MGDLLTDAEARISVLQTQITTSPVQFTEADVELLDALRIQCIDMRALHEDDKRTITVLKRQATLYEKEKSQLEAAVSTKAKEIEAAEERARDQVESIRNEMASAFEKLESANAALAESRRQLGDLSEEVTNLRSLLETKEGQLESRRENDAHLREGWFQMKRERDGYAEKLEETDRQLAAARERINEVIEERVQAIAEVERRYADLEAKTTEGPLGELIRKADALTSIGHGVVAGDRVNTGSKNWADSAYETLESLAALR